jgi:hypothetical protein
LLQVLGSLWLHSISQGVYCWTPANVGITGALTLAGPAGSQWVFQIAGTLTVADGASIVLSGGATACGVFFAVTSASLGTTAAFQGSILAYAAISARAGATVNGRLISSTAAVTLLSNVVDVSACSAGSVEIVADASFGVAHLLTPKKQLRVSIAGVAPSSAALGFQTQSVSSVSAYFDKTGVSASVDLGSAKSYAVRPSSVSLALPALRLVLIGAICRSSLPAPSPTPGRVLSLATLL